MFHLTLARGALVDSVIAKEDKPFGQYWGLQAIGRVLPSAPPNVLQEAKSKLMEFQARVPSGTDRDYETRRLLREIEQTVQD